MTLKDRIVDAAYELFGEQGYDKTSVAQIIDKAGASKGGFYHHFKSKEEILETITFSYIDLIHRHYTSILKDETMTLVEKFQAAYTRVNDIKLAAAKDWDKIKNLYAYKDNHLLLKKMGQAFEKHTADFYYDLIMEGVASAVFDVAYPRALATLWGREVIQFQQLSRYVLMGRSDQEVFYETLKFNEQLINSQLGLEASTINLVVMGSEYLEALREEMKGKVL